MNNNKLSANYDIRKINYELIVKLIKQQKLSYKEISDVCLSLLTPLEQEMLRSFLDMKGCYLTNVSQLENGKNISIFIPEFEIKSYQKSYIIESYELTWKKCDDTLFVKKYRFLPRLVEFPSYYEPKIKECVGCHNGYGWIVVNARIVKDIYYNTEYLY